MRFLRFAALPIALSLAACSSTNKRDTGVPDPESNSEPAADLAPTRPVEDGRFATSLICATCHQNSSEADAMRDERGNPIGPFDLWRSTMMANSARDPLWRAVVSAEVAAIPSKKSDIEATCMGCHAPMAATEAKLGGESPIAMSLLYDDSARSQIALDGVSCTGCHQIAPDRLGTEASYSGNFVIGDDRVIYGPHADPFPMPMRRHTGYLPQQADHVSRSAMCASCHTLHTRALSPTGDETGDTLPEQAPYLEWRNSIYSTEVASPSAEAADCQDCHMPSTSEAGIAITTAIARNPGGFDFPMLGARTYSRHVFVGGNTLVPQLLRDNPDHLSPLASAAAFDATIALARAQLANHTATLAIENAVIRGERLTATLAIANLAGHKFPTAHPSRRAWLHVTVTATDGTVVFESGRHDAAGVLVDAQGAPLPAEIAGGPTHSHVDMLDATSGPLVYEVVMADAAGAVTYRLMQGARYLKDNRLLPRGWSAANVTDHIKTVGVADPNFAAGGDRIAVDVATSGAPGPFTIKATLLYQPLGARYAAELLAVDTPEVRSLGSMLDRTDRRPETVATAEVVVPAP